MLGLEPQRLGFVVIQGRIDLFAVRVIVGKRSIYLCEREVTHFVAYVLGIQAKTV